ncbi:MAG: hypothetical protein ACK4KX_03260 [Parvibaculum sp.]|uniref:hypothetical protein n=1 Tax=Parvibaculum sp. TaxID=2024848 RepID=UPI00391BEA5E
MTGFFPTCQDIFLTVAAGAEAVRAANAETLAIIAATAPFEIAFDAGSFQFADAGLTYQGRAKEGEPRPRFGELRFRNPNAFPISIRVQVSHGEIFDNRAIFGGNSVPVMPSVGAIFDVAQYGTWNVGQAGTWNVGLTGTYLPREAVPVTISNTGNLTCAANAVTNISAATTTRNRFVLHHLGTETMFIKTGTNANTNGIPLCPGERIEIRTNGALNIFNPAAFSQDIRRAEVNW